MYLITEVETDRENIWNIHAVCSTCEDMACGSSVGCTAGVANFFLYSGQYMMSCIVTGHTLLGNSVVLSSLANYTDRAIAAGQRN
jgi:hypothetical protein